jgi:hypothetical protein
VSWAHIRWLNKRTHDSKWWSLQTHERVGAVDRMLPLSNTPYRDAVRGAAAIPDLSGMAGDPRMDSSIDALVVDIESIAGDLGRAAKIIICDEVLERVSIYDRTSIRFVAVDDDADGIEGNQLGA